MEAFTRWMTLSGVAGGAVIAVALMVLGVDRLLEVRELKVQARQHGTITIRGDYWICPDEMRQRGLPLKGYRVVSADDKKLTVEYFFESPLELGPGNQYPVYRLPASQTAR